jgi:hypothetical protein
VDASPSSPGPQTTDAPVAQPESDDSGSGIPPLLFVGIGGVLLAGVAVAVWRSRRGRTTGQAG